MMKMKMKEEAEFILGAHLLVKWPPMAENGPQ
jgi:hypothetical protein